MAGGVQVTDRSLQRKRAGPVGNMAIRKVYQADPLIDLPMALSLTLGRRRSFALASASVLVGCVLAIALLAAAELVVRGTSDVNFNGISANLFSPNRFGTSIGNTPEISAVAFGTEVFTDANGFRVPGRDYRYPQEFEGSILILGDSVPFGPGVGESETFPGLLRLQNPRLRVYNAAVIGHATPDYPNVLAAVLEKTSPSKVLLFLCLNDISTASAAELEKVIVKTAAASDAARLAACLHPRLPPRRLRLHPHRPTLLLPSMQFRRPKTVPRTWSKNCGPLTWSRLSTSF